MELLEVPAIVGPPLMFALTDEAFNDVAQGNTRFRIVATELMKAIEDTCVGHRLAAWSLEGRFGYDKCLVHQDILIGGVESGEDLESRLGCEGEWGPITCPGKVASTRLVVVAMSALLVITEGMLVAIIPFFIAGYLGCLGWEQNAEVGLGQVLKQVEN
ncbi:unnamed protein product [Prunus armeniaca]